MIASGTEIATGDRVAWLAERRKGIGASECAAALGLSPFETPLSLWARKLGLQPDVAENEAMEIGTLMEPIIEELYERRTGWGIAKTQIFVREPGPGILSATIDGLRNDDRPVEFKTISAFKAGSIGDEDTDELPEHWLCQAAQQMYLLNAPRLDFAILIGGQRFAVRTVERNDRLIAAMLPRLREFWRCVETREAPPAMGADVAFLQALHPGCEGEVELTSDLAAWASEYQGYGVMIREMEDARDQAKARLLEALGDHAIGLLPDGRRIKRTITPARRQEAYDVKESVRVSILKAKETR
jgi:putative phage-type endonuclease